MVTKARQVMHSDQEMMMTKHLGMSAVLNIPTQLPADSPNVHNMFGSMWLLRQMDKLHRALNHFQTEITKVVAWRNRQQIRR